MAGMAKQAVVGVTAALTLCGASGTALAYGKPGHDRIPFQAWEAMRAAVAGDQLYDAVGGLQGPWVVTPGPCAAGLGNCGRTVTQQEWDTFVVAIQRAMMRLNTFQNHLPSVVPCTDPAVVNSGQHANEQVSLADLQFAVDVSHFNHMLEGGLQEPGKGRCRLYSSPLPQNGFRKAATDLYAPQGMFADFLLSRLLEGNQNQGSVLGFYAKLRDDDENESVLYASPVTGVAENAFDVTVAGAVLPIVCIFELLAGKTDCISKARELAHDADFIDELDWDLPHVGLPRSESYIGFWHFIDARGRTGEFNDAPGLAYQTAGPEGIPGARDQAIAIAAELSTMRVNPDSSTGPDRYQISNPTDGLPASKLRNHREWALHNVGETEFSPLDNLAYYGFENYKASIAAGTPGIEHLGWPLHAIGDATVPHHVAITSGHGHRAYEDWVDLHLDEIYYVQRGCNGTCEQTMLQAQFEQVHRMLEYAFRYREFLLSHGIRDLVTQLAGETLTEVGGSQLLAWPFCDACDVASVANGNGLQFLYEWGATSKSLFTDDPLVQKMVQDPVGYYDDSEDNSRKLQERAVGATVAFLMFASELACKVTTEPCAAANECCAGYICTAGACQPDPGPL